MTETATLQDRCQYIPISSQETRYIYIYININDKTSLQIFTSLLHIHQHIHTYIHTYIHIYTKQQPPTTKTTTDSFPSKIAISNSITMALNNIEENTARFTSPRDNGAGQEGRLKGDDDDDDEQPR